MSTLTGGSKIPGSGPYYLDRGEGEQWWFLGALLTLKVTGEQSGNGFTLVEARQPRGHGSALHVHRHDDEIFFVLEGEVRLQVGDDERTLTAGMMGYGPRGVKHSFIVTSEEARQLVMTTPSGFENLVRSLGEPAQEARIPFEQTLPDRATLLEKNIERGVEILGPPMTLE